LGAFFILTTRGKVFKERSSLIFYARIKFRNAMLVSGSTNIVSGKNKNLISCLSKAVQID
jgi:hypothetical protein